MITLFVFLTISLIFIIFGQNKPQTIQDIVTTTNEQFQSFKVSIQILLNSLCIILFLGKSARC